MFLGKFSSVVFHNRYGENIAFSFFITAKVNIKHCRFHELLFALPFH